MDSSGYKHFCFKKYHHFTNKYKTSLLRTHLKLALNVIKFIRATSFSWYNLFYLHCKQLFNSFNTVQGNSADSGVN